MDLFLWLELRLTSPIAVLLQCDGCAAESALCVTTTTFCGLFEFLSWWESVWRITISSLVWLWKLQQKVNSWGIFFNLDGFNDGRIIYCYAGGFRCHMSARSRTLYQRETSDIHVPSSWPDYILLQRWITDTEWAGIWLHLCTLSKKMHTCDFPANLSTHV